MLDQDPELGRWFHLQRHHTYSLLKYHIYFKTHCNEVTKGSQKSSDRLREMGKRLWSAPKTYNNRSELRLTLRRLKK